MMQLNMSAPGWTCAGLTVINRQLFPKVNFFCTVLLKQWSILFNTILYVAACNNIDLHDDLC